MSRLSVRAQVAERRQKYVAGMAAAAVVAVLVQTGLPRAAAEPPVTVEGYTFQHLEEGKAKLSHGLTTVTADELNRPRTATLEEVKAMATRVRTEIMADSGWDIIDAGHRSSIQAEALRLKTILHQIPTDTAPPEDETMRAFKDLRIALDYATGDGCRERCVVDGADLVVGAVLLAEALAHIASMAVKYGSSIDTRSLAILASSSIVLVAGAIVAGALVTLGVVAEVNGRPMFPVGQKEKIFGALLTILVNCAYFLDDAKSMASSVEGPGNTVREQLVAANAKVLTVGKEPDVSDYDMVKDEL